MAFSLILSPTLFIGKVSYFFCIKWLKQEFFPFGCYKVRWPIAIFVHMIMVVSSEGALYVILPYDYPAAQQHPLFEHTPVLNNNFEY